MTTSPRRDISGFVLVAGYMVLWLGVLVVVNVVAGLLATVDVALRASAGATVVSSALPGWVVTVGLYLQFAGMVAAIPMADRLGRGVFPSLQGEDAVWSVRLAWVTPPRWAWIAAVVIGSTAGWLPGRLADLLRTLAPAFNLGALDALNDAILSGPWLARIAMAIGIVVVAPLAEEILFRGWMWNVLRRGLPPWAVWVVTSVLFAAYHIDPIQGIALVFTALALGWVRWMTGSLWPCVAIHALNNLLGVSMAYLSEQGTAPVGLAVSGAMLTIAAAGQLHIRRITSGGSMDDDAVPPSQEASA